MCRANAGFLLLYPVRRRSVWRCYRYCTVRSLPLFSSIAALLQGFTCFMSIQCPFKYPYYIAFSHHTSQYYLCALFSLLLSSAVSPLVFPILLLFIPPILNIFLFSHPLILFPSYSEVLTFISLFFPILSLFRCHCVQWEAVGMGTHLSSSRFHQWLGSIPPRHSLALLVSGEENWSDENTVYSFIPLSMLLFVVLSSYSFFAFFVF